MVPGAQQRRTERAVKRFTVRRKSRNAKGLVITPAERAVRVRVRSTRRAAERPRRGCRQSRFAMASNKYARDGRSQAAHHDATIRARMPVQRRGSRCLATRQLELRSSRQPRLPRGSHAAARLHAMLANCRYRCFCGHYVQRDCCGRRGHQKSCARCGRRADRLQRPPCARARACSPSAPPPEPQRVLRRPACRQPATTPARSAHN